MIFFPYGMRKQNHKIHKSKLKKSKPKKGIDTLPETNMAPKNDGFQ